MDASTCGNETRFMNDFHGIGNQNAKFRILWVAGEMHLFIQAYDDIEIGDEVLVSYGVNYWNQVEEW
jgi:SET domain-containing protein